MLIHILDHKNINYESRLDNGRTYKFRNNVMSIEQDYEKEVKQTLNKFQEHTKAYREEIISNTKHMLNVIIPFTGAAITVNITFIGIVTANGYDDVFFQILVCISLLSLIYALYYEIRSYLIANQTWKKQKNITEKRSYEIWDAISRSHLWPEGNYWNYQSEQRSIESQIADIGDDGNKLIGIVQKRYQRGFFGGISILILAALYVLFTNNNTKQNYALFKMDEKILQLETKLKSTQNTNLKLIDSMNKMQEDIYDTQLKLSQVNKKTQTNRIYDFGRLPYSVPEIINPKEIEIWTDKINPIPNESDKLGKVNPNK